MAMKRTVHQLGPRRGGSETPAIPSVRLEPAQSALLEQVREAARTGEYDVLRTADPDVLQTLWDRGLIRVRSVPAPRGVSLKDRARVREALLKAMRDRETPIAGRWLDERPIPASND